jgi:hypothetical protein
LTSAAIEPTHAMNISIETGRVTERGSGFNIGMNRVETPPVYRRQLRRWTV